MQYRVNIYSDDHDAGRRLLVEGRSKPVYERTLQGGILVHWEGTQRVPVAANSMDDEFLTVAVVTARDEHSATEAVNEFIRSKRVEAAIREVERIV